MAWLAAAYMAYFLLLGGGARCAFHWIRGSHSPIGQATDFMPHAFFQGVFLHVVMLNLWQWTGWGLTGLWWCLGVVLLATMVCVLRQWLVQRPLSLKWRPEPSQGLVLLLMLLASWLLWRNGSWLPNLAWDSWIVWEGKAQQWINHGLAADIVSWEAWLAQDQAFFNPSASYPDGLSLLYFLPMALSHDSFAVMHVVLLFAFAMMTWLVVNRLRKMGAATPWLLLAAGVLYTTPLMGNHLMIHGYADLWLGLYVLLIMVSLIDYFDAKASSQNQPTGLGLTVLAYVAMLPLLKLEGWVWLMVFVLAYGWCRMAPGRHRWLLLLGVGSVLGVILLAGGLQWASPWGDLAFTPDRIALFHLFDFPIGWVDITDALLTGLLWQNNWGLIWLGLPWLLLSPLRSAPDPTTRVPQVFLIMALAAFLFLFYFTPASQWALDMTAINRIVLQLTPCYVFLLFGLFAQWSTAATNQSTAAQKSPA
ncbi:hypothetical protein [Marinicella meishanensis]|uniref:hypothetical protein n=1 Tax=Marinicella meishanensis TaxID=2873263 RepID=UPI001CBE9ACC|nr:hypothetical protein [Marinicella sp. NBU2979]